MARPMLNTGGGDYDPYVKYNVKAGRWSYKGDDGEVEVGDKLSFVADFDNFQSGWLLIKEGEPPDWVADPSLGQMAPEPSDAHKRGFSVRLFSDKIFGGVVEWRSSTSTLCDAILELWDVYDANKDKNKDKLPVVSVDGAVPIKTKYGTNYKPKMSIEKWVDVPSQFSGSEKAAVVEQDSEPEF